MMKVIVFLFAILAIAMSKDFLPEDKDQTLQDYLFDDTQTVADQSLTILADAGTLLAQAGANDAEFDFWIEVQSLVDFIGDWAY